jgi:uncharacterized RmlC-like cupin family protein
MKTLNITPEQMERQIARFARLQPQKGEYEKRGIPIAAFEMLAAKTIYALMAPEGGKGMTAAASVVGPAGVTVNIVKCPPGNGPMLHAHMKTQESFMALSGRWEVRWGDDAQHATTLEQFDFVAVPPGTARQFKNLSDQDALLLVLVQGEEALNDFYYSPAVGQQLTERFGSETKAAFERIGFSFEMGT